MARESQQMPETLLSVGSGSFKVDRRLALEKLKEFQLPDPDMFLLPWIRCAVASGATSVTLDLDSKKIKFKARFRREELSDPYRCLFDEAAAVPPRNRQLAYALLATLSRLKSFPFILTSGSGRERIALRVTSPEETTFDDPARFCPRCKAQYRVGFFTRCTDCGVDLVEWCPNVESGSDTVVSLGSGWFAPNPLWYSDEGEGEVGVIGVSAPVEYVLDHHIPEMISIQVLPEKVAQFIRDRSRKKQRLLPDHTLEFRKGSLRGWLRLPSHLKPDSSRLRLAHFGVFVETVEERSTVPVIPVEGTINDNKFDLSISHSSVVRNDQYYAAIRETMAQAEELVRKVCSAHAAWMLAAGKVLKSLLLQRTWARWFRLGEEAEGGSFWSLDLDASEQISYLWKYVSSIDWPDPEWAAEENRRLIWSTARVTAWLRNLCALVRNEQLAIAKETRRGLEAAPIFWGINETLLSMADFEKVLSTLGHVPVSTHKGDRHYPVVWTFCQEERAALDRIFPRAIGDITQTEKQLLAAPGPDAGTEAIKPAKANAATLSAVQELPLAPTAPGPEPIRRTERPDSLATQSDGERVLQLAHHVLSHLCGRDGMKLPGQSVPPLRLQRLSDGGLLNIRSEECWVLNDAHPLTKAMLDSSLPDSEKSVYLASLIYTAANRDLASVTDQDDVKFQLALADHLTEGLTLLDQFSNPRRSEKQ